MKIKKETKVAKKMGGKSVKLKKEEKKPKKKAKRKKKKRKKKSKIKREIDEIKRESEEDLPDGVGPGRYLGTDAKKRKWIPLKRDVAFKMETTRDEVEFTPDTPADRRLLMDVAGGLEIAKKYCENVQWNCIHPLGKKKRVGHSCVLCGMWLGGGGARHIVEHEQSCLGGYSKDKVLNLAQKCWGKVKCREVRIPCRWALGHQCYLSPRKEKDALKEEEILKRLNGDRKGDERILSVNELLYSRKDFVKKKKKGE